MSSKPSQESSPSQTGSQPSDPQHPVWRVANLFPGTDFGEQAWLAFRHDLPRLLEGHQGEWAAYRGGQLLGTGLTATDLYDRCLDRGVAPEELIVCQIEPIVGEETLGMSGVECRYEE